MADTFTTSLSIRQIETGTRSGTWGTETNTQYQLFDNAFSYVNHDLSSDADATLTISDGSASDARYFYIKFTSAVSLTATRTITLAPDDTSKIWIVENATTGSQDLTFKQGSSGSTVTLSNGNTMIIYADGAGATNGAIINALTDLQLSDSLSLKGGTPTFTIGDGGEEDTKIVYDGNAKDFYIGLDDSADKLVIGEGSTVGTNNIVTIDDDSVTIGDGAEVDTKIVFDGNAQDYYVGLDDSADDLVIGLGSAVGTTPAISVDENQFVTMPKKVTASTSANISQVAITSSSNAVAWDAQAAANAFYLTTENTTFSAPSNAVEGAIISVEIAQGATPYTVAWNTVFEFAASTAPTITATANKTDIFSFRYNGSVWQEIGRVQNLAQT